MTAVHDDTTPDTHEKTEKVMGLKVVYNDALKKEYQQLFDKCTPNAKGVAFADPVVKKIVANKARYQSIANKVGCPWYFVGLIHHMECNLLSKVDPFTKHIHNGDPLAKKTTHVPANRPAGNAPWTWEQSALDSLISLKGFNKWKDWSVPGMLWLLEGYNGYGYRMYHPNVKTPYLWSFSNIYSHGKYIADNVWSETTVSEQLGCAVTLKRGVQLGLFK